MYCWLSANGLRYNVLYMRMFRYLPLAYIAGVHGFALFAPYLALFLTLGHVLHRIAEHRAAAAAIRVTV